MTQILEITVSHRIATLIINNPPVNALSSAVRQAILDAIDEAEESSEVQAIVIGSKGTLFSGGADIREFDLPIVEPGLPGLIDRVESCTKPVVIALFGVTLGGGFELAMGCHYRVAAPSTFVGLPEVHLGLIPGAGGTQRLPRLVGVEAAIDVITSGRHVSCEEALRLGAIDEIAEDDLTYAACEAAKRLMQASQLLPRTSDRVIKSTSIPKGIFSAMKSNLAKRRRGFDAPQAAVDAIEWAVREDFREGLRKERARSKELKASLQSKAQRHLFFAQRMALKIPGIPKETPLRNIESVGVIGGGTMGVGIVLCILNAGFEVTLIEVQRDALDTAIKRIRDTLDKDVDRRRLSEQERDHRLERFSYSLNLVDLSSADLVIEAVFESLQLKKNIFLEVSKIVSQQTIIATNTSALDINEISSVCELPERVLGMHFFSPANIMKLLEVVRGEKTAKDVIATAMALGKRIGKVPALSGVGYGFIGNRMLEDYVRESQLLLLEGATPAQVDGVLEGWGMAMGPCAVMDLAGQDVSFLTRDQNRHFLPNDPAYYKPGDLMNELGRLGQKKGAGFYKYTEGYRRQEDLEAVRLIEAAASELGIEQRGEIEDEEIFRRCMYALINRGAQLLDDGIALRASDIDVVWSAGYGFPKYRGGPMFYADSIGLVELRDTFEDYAKCKGNSFGYWTPSPLLVKLASEGKTFRDFDRDRQGGS